MPITREILLVCIITNASFSCRTSYQSSTVAEVPGSSDPIDPLRLGPNPFGYPYVDDQVPDSPLVEYAQDARVYDRFSKSINDPAKTSSGKFLMEVIAEKEIVNSPYKIETEVLNGTEFEPIPLPRKAILAKLNELRKKYWRYGPGVDYEKLSPTERALPKNIYGTIGSYVQGQDPIYDSYPLEMCLGGKPPHWGVLQIDYFCMIPAAFRGCYRYLLNNSQLEIGELYYKGGKTFDDRLLTADKGNLLREVVHAICLVHRGKRDDPLYERLVQRSKVFTSMGIKSGAELFDLLETNETLDGILAKATDPILKTDAEFQDVFDAARNFYRDQEFSVEGKDVNLFDYLMYAPPLQFRLEDQLAIHNSFFYPMGSIYPAKGTAYWPPESDLAVDQFCFGKRGAMSCAPDQIIWQVGSAQR